MAKHTPGPWMAAAKPSSVVGLPVVARPSGRSIANVTLFNLGEGFKNHDDESQANARLIAAAPDLLAALSAILANHETVGAGASIFQVTTAEVTAARAALAKALCSR